MAKQSGLGDQLFVGGYDLGDDIGSLGNIGGGPAALPVTPITKKAFVRIGGKRDGQMEYTAFFNPSEDRAHDRLSALPTTDQLVTYLRGQGQGSPAANLVAKQINYDGSRGDDGAFTFAVQAQGNKYGLEWGEQLTDGLQTDSEATDSDGVDFGAAGTFGLQAYLQVTSFTGTSATITLEQSSDDEVTDDYAAVTDGAFTAVTGPTWERIATAGDQAVEQYLRVATTGTFTELTFLVAVTHNKTLTEF